LNVEKNLLLIKQTQVQANKAWGKQISDTKITRK